MSSPVRSGLITSESRGAGGWFERFGALGGLLLLCCVLSILSPNFLSVDNLMNVARQISINGIVAVGMTIVIATSGIDLSVGSVLALSACAAALMTGHVPLGVALMGGIVVGALSGLFNGLLITLLRISPFIATLGMMSMARGGALVLTDGMPIDDLPPGLNALAGQVGPIPVPLLVMVVVAVLGAVILNRTSLGRVAIALGSNEEAARLSGIPVHRFKLAIYAFNGALAGLAGIMLMARLSSAQPSGGGLMELDAIAAVVIGGASLMGGKASIGGTIVGVTIIGVLRNGLVLLDVSAFWQQLVIGIVIIMAVAADQWRTQRRPGGF